MLIELLRRATADAPDQPAIIYGGRSRTYAECLERSEAIAAGLHQRGIDRFGCVMEDPINTLVTLAGSSAIGSEACVYPGGLDTNGINRLSLGFGHRVIVTDCEESSDGFEALSVHQLTVHHKTLPPPADTSPVLILTTGTTGTPKGATHDWSRLVGAMRRDQRAGTRWLLAYDLNQFGGVQILLHVLASKGTLVAPASRNMKEVIAAIREHAVTHVSATPTFWRLLVSALTANPDIRPALEQITLGGEAVAVGLIEQIRRLFPNAHISQIYGATESGTAVSVTDGRNGLPLSILDRDESADVRIRIVNGELHMKSRIGMLGYYHAPSDEQGWWPTGDLVEVRGDRIHFVGRVSEVINVGGAKINPLPVEELIGSIDGVRFVSVYGLRNPVTGQIVSADVVARPGVGHEMLEKEIRGVCESLPDRARPRRIRFVDALELQGSKVRRGPRG